MTDGMNGFSALMYVKKSKVGCDCVKFFVLMYLASAKRRSLSLMSKWLNRFS
jgi:hypothetical protein